MSKVRRKNKNHIGKTEVRSYSVDLGKIYSVGKANEAIHLILRFIIKSISKIMYAELLKK